MDEKMYAYQRVLRFYSGDNSGTLRPELSQFTKTRSRRRMQAVPWRIWHTIQLALLLFGAFWVSSVRAQTQHANVQPLLPKSVADLIIPVLDIRYESIQECGTGKDFRCTSGGPAADRDIARWHKIEKLVARLMKNNSPSGDQAVVLLLQYYVGESESTDLVTNVTARGKRVLPYLLRYRDLVPQIPARSYPASILTESEFRKTEFDQAIDAIKSGKILTVD